MTNNLDEPKTSICCGASIKDGTFCTYCGEHTGAFEDLEGYCTNCKQLIMHCHNCTGCEKCGSDKKDEPL